MATATNKNKPSTSAKVLYRPVGIVSSIAGGMIASVLFKQIWKRVSPSADSSDDVPGPLESEYPFKEILLAAVLQGAIYAGVKTAVDRQGARAFQRATGEWPGN
jgi:hypothetical protein